MNKIVFKGESKGWVRKFEIFLGLLSLFSVIYILIAFVFEWFKFDSKLLNIVIILCFIIVFIYSRFIFLIHKNIVKWNNSDIIIKINSFWPIKSISWDLVENISYYEVLNELTIDVLGKRKHIISLKNIDAESVDELISFIKKHSLENSSYYTAEQ